MSETKDDFFLDSFEDEDLQEYLNRVINILEISNPKYRIKPATKSGDNWIGIVYRVLIEGDKNGAPFEISTIFKVPPKDENLRITLKIADLFSREHLFYTEIVPIIRDFLKSKNKKLENIPECFFSSADERKEIVCLEDLRPKGFVMRDRMQQMDFAHISLAFRALGRLHALSFALRDQRPDIFASKITTLSETMCRPDMIADKSFVFRFEKLGELVKTALAEEDPVYAERFSDYSKDILSLLGWTCDGRNAEPHAVLGHGDFWINNMLFKYDDEDSSEPREICLIDFQVARYASPALDISYIIFCNCSHELRVRHYDELVVIYHDSLSDYLSELGSDPKKLFPFEALLSQLEKFSVYGAGMAMEALSDFTSQGDDVKCLASDNEDLPGLEERIKRDHFWRNTLRDTFKDLIDRNYI